MRIVTSWVAAGLALLACTPGNAHLPHDEIRSIAVSPAYQTDRTVFASLSHTFKFFLKSADGGVTWSPSQTGLPYGTVSSIAVSPGYDQDATVFVGINDSRDEGFVFGSADGGATWAAASTGLPGSEILSIAGSPDFATDRTLFAGTDGDGVFVTTDAGASWTPLNLGPVNGVVRSIAVSADFATDRTLFAGTNAGLLKSTDAGQSWLGPFLQGAVLGLALSPAYAQDQTLFVGISGGGIFRSQNGGASWSAKSTGLGELFVTSVAFSPDFPVDRTLLASTEDGVYRTTSAGDSWTLQAAGLARLSGQSDAHYAGFGISPSFGQDRTVFLASFDGAHRSENGADSWKQLDIFSQKVLRGLDVSPDFANDRTVYAGSYGGGVYRSVDGGDTWASVTTGLRHMFMHPLAVSPDFASDHTVFAGYFEHLARSVSRGRIWSDDGVAPPDFRFTRKLAISPGFAVDRTLFIADDLQGTNTLYKSIDGGNTFMPLDVPIAVARSLAVSTSYQTDQTLFAGTGLITDLDAGIYRSQDGGVNWDYTLNGPGVLALAVSPAFQTDGTVFAGTLKSGVLKSTDWGDTWAPVNAGFEPVVMIESLAISPAFSIDQTVFAGTRTHGVYKSTDGGQTWSYAGLPGDHVPTLVVSPAFGTDRTVFAGGWEGAYRSTDGGASWSRVLNIRRYDDRNEFMVRTKNWISIPCQPCSSTSLIAAFEALATVELDFVGHSVSWIGGKAPNGGIANLYVDGALAGQVDLYAPQLAVQEKLFTKSGLTPGAHTFAIEVSGAKNALSSGLAVFVDAIQIGY